jgi:hypothetical protein
MGKPAFTSNDMNLWATVTDKKGQVAPTDYGIRSIVASPGSRHPKSCAIDIGTDGGNLDEIDHEEDSTVLNVRLFMRTFAVADPFGS